MEFNVIDVSNDGVRRIRLRTRRPLIGLASERQQSSPFDLINRSHESVVASADVQRMPVEREAESAIQAVVERTPKWRERSDYNAYMKAYMAKRRSH